MTFEFAVGAKVVIEQGARLILNNSTFTSTTCESLWQGIEVQGDASASQLATNPTGLRRQGQLIVQNNSLIENAKEAITLWVQGNLATAGGIVWATNSTFRNNWRCAEFIRYRNFTPGLNTTAGNISFFKDCIFETTVDVLSNGQSPLTFVSMWDVEGITFRGNTFRNTSTQTDITKRGYGIKSIDAKYTVEAYCTSILTYGTPCPAANLRPNRFEGLYYGIDASASNALNTVTIRNNIFTANLRGILLRGIDFATITENSFNIGSPYSNNAQSYGLYTDNCSGYKIEGNNFFSTYGGTIGTYTWLSGTAPNRIYRNTFNNVLVGSAASLNNGQAVVNGTFVRTGLEYRCNSYNCGIIDIGVLSGAIAENQGFCHIGGSDPAGNTFTQANSFNLFKNPNTQPFYYFYHSNAGNYAPRLQAISPNIAISPIYCSAYNGNKDCKSTLYPNTGDIRGTKQELSVLINQGRTLIDAGNTAGLINTVNNASPGQAKNAMMAVAPYTSDLALLAYLSTNRPSGHINQVIAANSPVTAEVWTIVCQKNLPTGIMNQLTALQVGTSARKELENTIDYYEKEIWLLNDELIRFYLNDTIVVNPMDSVIALLKEEGRQKMKCQQLAAEIKAGKLLDAEATIDTIKAANGGIITDNYCKLLGVLLELAKIQESCTNMDSDKENTVRDIASDETKRGCAQAKALLDIAFSEFFPETIEWMQNSNRMASEGFLEAATYDGKEEVETVLSTAPEPFNTTYNFTAYPNPFSDKLIVNTSIPNETQSAELVIFDIIGQELLRISLQKGDNNLEINGSSLKEGLLFYNLLIDGKTVVTEKILHLK
jgi:hypothetical protein